MGTDKYHIQVSHHLRVEKNALNEYDQYAVYLAILNHSVIDMFSMEALTFPRSAHLQLFPMLRSINVLNNNNNNNSVSPKIHDIPTTTTTTTTTTTIITFVLSPRNLYSWRQKIITIMSNLHSDIKHIYYRVLSILCMGLGGSRSQKYFAILNATWRTVCILTK